MVLSGAILNYTLFEFTLFKVVVSALDSGVYLRAALCANTPVC